MGSSAVEEDLANQAVILVVKAYLWGIGAAKEVEQAGFRDCFDRGEGDVDGDLDHGENDGCVESDFGSVNEYLVE